LKIKYFLNKNRKKKRKKPKKMKNMVIALLMESGKRSVVI